MWWANAWNVFRRAPSRVGRGRRAAVNFVVCFGWGDFFFRAFHEFTFSNSFVDSVSEQPAWTRRRRSDSQPIFPPRTRAHLSQPGVPFSVLLPENLASAVDQHSSSRPVSMIFDPTSECNLNKLFSKLRERQSHLLARKKTQVDVRKREVEAFVLRPSIPAGRCVGACLLYTSPSPRDRQKSRMPSSA